MEMTIKINGHPYRINVYDNQTTEEVIKHLPEELVMEDLNNNEKYASLNINFPTNAEEIEKIYKGDVMLYESNTLVIFYKDFETSYSYTPVGKIDDPDNLKEVVGSGQIVVQFLTATT